MLLLIGTLQPAPPPQPAQDIPLQPVQVNQNAQPATMARGRRPDPSMLIKLSADVDLIQLVAWKRWWADFARLEDLASLDV